MNIYGVTSESFKVTLITYQVRACLQILRDQEDESVNNGALMTRR